MKRLFIYILVLACSHTASMAESPLSSFIINGNKSYSAQVEFLITLPITEQDVKYNVKIYSIPALNDSILPIRYLIEATDTAYRKSIYAYFDGNCFNFSGGKFREYHWHEDSLPFRSTTFRGRNLAGIHKSGLFATLIPELLTEQIAISSDNPYNKVSLVTDTLVYGKKSNVLKIDEYINGIIAREMKFITNSDTKEPIHYEIITSPGTAGEQTIEATFTSINDTAEINEPALIARYEDIFSTYRTSNFSASTLSGKKLPPFNLPSLTGERYAWDSSSNSPTIATFLDSEDSLTQETIVAISQAIEALPFNVTALWLFTDKDTENIKHTTTSLHESSGILLNAKHLATQCGITSTPTILIIDSRGTIKDVIIGYGNNLESEVMQRMLLATRNSQH